MDVILVHGFLDTVRLFRRLAAHLDAKGHACHAPTLGPRDGRTGIPDLSGKLARYIADNVEGSAPIALVGFSMGAVVSRHYLQSPGGAQRTRAFFSIAAPYRGTPTAYFYPSLGVRQLRPRSAFLRAMGAGLPEGIPTFTYRTPFDLMVFPPSTTRIAGATETIVPTLFHSLLPGDRRVAEHISRELERLG